MTSPPPEWSQLRERGTYSAMKSLVWIYRLIGPRGLDAMLYAVTGFYFLCSTRARAASREYLTQMHRYLGECSPWKHPPGRRESFRHFMAFARAAADKVTVRMCRYRPEDIVFVGRECYDAVVSSGKGAVIVASHLGNADICQAIKSRKGGAPLTVLTHQAHAPNFNRLLAEVTGDIGNVEVLCVQGWTPEIGILLHERIDAGTCVVITGDRTAADSRSRYESCLFLGREAPFAQGPFLMAGLLDCPVLLMFSMKSGAGYRVYFEPFADAANISRSERGRYVSECVARYATRLEYYACAYPLQWFNFYDYWAMPRHERNDNA
jgi:predicted LPLAT superfamily acyltransferase